MLFAFLSNKVPTCLLRTLVSCRTRTLLRGKAWNRHVWQSTWELESRPLNGITASLQPIDQMSCVLLKQAQRWGVWSFLIFEWTDWIFMLISNYICKYTQIDHNVCKFILWNPNSTVDVTPKHGRAPPGNPVFGMTMTRTITCIRYILAYRGSNGNWLPGTALKPSRFPAGQTLHSLDCEDKAQVRQATRWNWQTHSTLKKHTTFFIKDKSSNNRKLYYWNWTTLM